MRQLVISPGQFSALVAAYTISSGVVGLLAAPFIDRFDRRNVMLFVYAGFAIGTLNCAMAHSTATLMTARIISGAFGGVSSATVLAIVSDVVPAQRRAAGIGIIMTAFSAAAALGVPFGLQLALHFNWEAPFFMLASIAGVMWVVAFFGVPHVRAHLHHHQGRRTQAFLELLRDANAGRALLFMAALVFGHFTIIPLLSAYLVANVGLPEKYLFLVYLVGGVLSVFTGPRIGRLADRFGSPARAVHPRGRRQRGDPGDHELRTAARRRRAHALRACSSSSPAAVSCRARRSSRWQCRHRVAAHS